ncbi:MAG: hypothetical protein HKN26_03155 [Acidimicrobiales bacterium]|nr:hypothetical protein [Acidimicrobiales bacterium]
MKMIVILVAFAPFLVDAARSRFRVSPATVTVVWLLPINIGLVMLGDYRAALLTSAALALFVHGYHSWHSNRARSRSPIVLTHHQTSGLVFATAITVALVAYHYAVVGIPLLSDSIETDRWNFRGSGLFGIPGRMMLVGLPLLAALWASVDGDARVSRYRWLTVGAGLASAVASGFKGGLITFLVLIVIGYTASHGWISYRRAARRFAPALIAGLVFAGASSQLYGNFIRVNQVDSPVEILIERVTVGPAEVAAHTFAVDGSVESLGGRSPSAVFDTLNLLQRYGGDETAFDTPGIIQRISADFRDRPIGTTDVVPTTPTAPATLYMEFGLWMIAIMWVVGLASAAAETAAAAKGTLLALLRCLAFQMIVFEFIAKGDVAFPALNWLIVGLMVGFLCSFGRVLNRSIAGSESALVLPGEPVSMAEVNA